MYSMSQCDTVLPVSHHNVDSAPVLFLLRFHPHFTNLNATSSHVYEDAEQDPRQMNFLGKVLVVMNLIIGHNDED